MTETYIIWRLNIWIKYMSINNLTVYYQALCEYWQRQDSTQTESSRNIIGYIFYNQIYYWSKMRIKIVEKCVMWLWCLPWLKNSGDPNITDWSCPRLSTQVVFTAAISKNPFMYPCILPFRPVRSSVCSAMGFTLPKKLCRERAVDQGATRQGVVAAERALSLHTFTVSRCLLGECESL